MLTLFSILLITRRGLQKLTAINILDSQIKKTLIYGAGAAGIELAAALTHNKQRQQKYLLGFIDDDKSKQGLYLNDLQVLGTRDKLKQLKADIIKPRSFTCHSKHKSL